MQALGCLGRVAFLQVARSMSMNTAKLVPVSGIGMVAWQHDRAGTEEKGSRSLAYGVRCGREKHVYLLRFFLCLLCPKTKPEKGNSCTKHKTLKPS